MNTLNQCNVDFQISGLLKDNEKIQSNPEVPPSEDDTEIKKIKKVNHFPFGFPAMLRLLRPVKVSPVAHGDASLMLDYDHGL